MFKLFTNDIHDKSYLFQNSQDVYQKIIMNLSSSLDLIGINAEYIEMHLNENENDYSYEKVSESINDIQNAKLSAESAFNKFISLIKIESNTLSPQMQQLNISKMFKTISLYSKEINRMIGMNLAFEISDDTDVLLKADRVFVENILLNLLCDNLKTCKTDQTIIFKLEKRDEEILITVKNYTNYNLKKCTAENPKSIFNEFKLGTNRNDIIENYLCAAYCRAMGWNMTIVAHEKYILTSIIISEDSTSFESDTTQYLDDITTEQIFHMNILRELCCIPGLEQLQSNYQLQALEQ